MMNDEKEREREMKKVIHRKDEKKQIREREWKYSMIEAKMEGEKENIRIHAMQIFAYECVCVCVYLHGLQHARKRNEAK